MTVHQPQSGQNPHAPFEPTGAVSGAEKTAIVNAAVAAAFPKTSPVGRAAYVSGTELEPIANKPAMVYLQVKTTAVLTNTVTIEVGGKLIYEGKLANTEDDRLLSFYVSPGEKFKATLGAGITSATVTYQEL